MVLNCPKVAMQHHNQNNDDATMMISYNDDLEQETTVKVGADK